MYRKECDLGQSLRAIFNRIKRNPNLFEGCLNESKVQTLHQTNIGYVDPSCLKVG